MSKPVLPLGGASSQGIVTVAEHGPAGMITLRGDLSSEALIKAVTDLTGAAMPGQRGANTNGDYGLLWMSPDELLILLPYAEADAAVATLDTALAGTHFLAVNVSDARAQFILKGAAVREVIAKIAPVDLSPAAFAPGEVRRTRFAQVAAGFWLADAETAHVFCFRSVAEYMFNTLRAVSVTGSEVGVFTA
ncbi:sarcosine oxidase subunit gamma [Tropicibacter naphthalenivorans]|uniref:Sarcosine oxidase, gamma subunit family n=1 Tax=Tropicibacter naphthalenivorans TaxID=441103 RepID=A0A0P1GXD5_9RHOB|nr:sarcosine oxidase subunit gamma family protein [Tropicibacter naphthalenivorans]CUH80021.1 sarcosine oxidase, gamma subunit family [Tropicibacter naphthalenivorans]SMC83539.1 sarcosine oxidase subunit gamma [Tropicibacter naphthalenivorans]